MISFFPDGWKQRPNRTVLAPPGETRSDAEQLFKETVMQY